MPKGAKCPKYVSGNSLKGSNIKKKIHAAGKKDAGGDEKLLIFFTWPKGYAISNGKFLKSKVFTTQCLAFIKMHF